MADSLSFISQEIIQQQNQKKIGTKEIEFDFSSQNFLKRIFYIDPQFEKYIDFFPFPPKKDMDWKILTTKVNSEETAFVESFDTLLNDQLSRGMFFDTNYQNLQDKADIIRKIESSEFTLIKTSELKIKAQNNAQKKMMIDRLNNQAVDLQNNLKKKDEDFRRQLEDLKRQVENLKNDRETERLAADNALQLEKVKNEKLSRKLSLIERGMAFEGNSNRNARVDKRVDVLPVGLVNAGAKRTSSGRKSGKSKTQSNVLTIQKQSDAKPQSRLKLTNLTKISKSRRRQQKRRNRNKTPPRCSDFDHKTGRSYSKYCKHSWNSVQKYGPGSRQFCSLVWHCINPNLKYKDSFDYRNVCKRTCFRIRKRFYSLSKNEGNENGNGNGKIRNICDQSFKVDFEDSSGCNYQQDTPVCQSHGVYRMSEPEVFKCF